MLGDMIPRTLAGELRRQLNEFPLVTMIGPRQAGKTTLARETFPEFRYVSLENPDEREFAQQDPRGFLATNAAPAIFDEIQRVPELLSYLQGIVDQNQTNGQYILTGSHELELRQAISQSLAGRTGMLNLLPLSIAELTASGRQLDTFEEYAFHGFLPRVHAQNQRPPQAYQAYYQTYVERDVRLLIQLKDAALFEKFVKLVAGRVGQVVNLSSLANDVGFSSQTIGNWLSILEASFIVFKLPPYFENFGKRVIKSPKYFFTDIGLLVHLLGIEKSAQITRDPLVGSIFENLVILEVLKARYNSGRSGALYFYRDSNQNELDLLFKAGSELVGVEIKSSATYHSSFKKMLTRFSNTTAPLARSFVVYNGEPRSHSDGVELLPFARSSEIA